MFFLLIIFVSVGLQEPGYWRCCLLVEFNYILLVHLQLKLAWEIRNSNYIKSDRTFCVWIAIYDGVRYRLDVLESNLRYYCEFSPSGLLPTSLERSSRLEAGIYPNGTANIHRREVWIVSKTPWELVVFRSKNQGFRNAVRRVARTSRWNVSRSCRYVPPERSAGTCRLRFWESTKLTYRARASRTYGHFRPARRRYVERRFFICWDSSVSLVTTSVSI